MEVKQTAVEWLVEQLEIMESKAYNNMIQIEMGRDNYKEIIEQAKEMEKEQIRNAYYTGVDDVEDNIDREAEQYYKETYDN